MAGPALLNRLHGTLPAWRAREAVLGLWRQWRQPAIVRRVPTSSTYVTRQALGSLARHLRNIDRERVRGDVVECGVAAGGSAALLGLGLTRGSGTRRLVLFDTFQGLPAPTGNDPDYEKAVAWTGQCRGTVEEVRRLCHEMGVDLSRVVFVPGLFQDTIPSQAPSSVALLHLDGDWYDSTHWCLTRLWPLLSRGGIVQIDDYGTWQGCRKATDEFLATIPRTAIHHIDGTAVWLRKA